MIISKTPLRISFAGGGTDIPSFYEHCPGAVVSTSIDKFVYITVNAKFDERIRVSYSKTEDVTSVLEIEHKLVRAALQLAGVAGGIEITSVADVPSAGTGLGSSSSFCVGLVNALRAYKGLISGPELLASVACQIEIDWCQEPIGKQDQYAAAFGGLNLYEFLPDGSVNVNPVVCHPTRVKELDEHLLVLYTGRTRTASSILADQQQNIKRHSTAFATLKEMALLSYAFIEALQGEDYAEIGQLVHTGWMMKKSLAGGISDSGIDALYARARANGALGGKLLGAGGGGFLMLLAPPDSHRRIRDALPELRFVPIHAIQEGSRIVFYQPN